MRKILKLKAATFGPQIYQDLQAIKIITDLIWNCVTKAFIWSKELE
jgi:hypothetical protein